jgi:hypothetical protein
MSSSATTHRFDHPWAGLVSGPLAWALGFQANYALADWQCVYSVYPAPYGLAIALIVSLLGGWLSVRAMQSADGGIAPPETMRTRRFVAGVSIGVAAIFSAVLTMQFVAALVFTGCER